MDNSIFPSKKRERANSAKKRFDLERRYILLCKSERKEKKKNMKQYFLK